MRLSELSALSAAVDRRRELHALLAQRPAVLSPEQAEALAAILAERAEEWARVAEDLADLRYRVAAVEAALARLSREPRPAPRTAQERRRTHPLTLGEAHPAVADPYTDDSAPMAQRVGVPEGDL